MDEPKDSEEFINFKTAMLKIVAAKKPDLVDDYPKMFRERKPPAGKKQSRRKSNPKVAPKSIARLISMYASQLASSCRCCPGVSEIRFHEASKKMVGSSRRDLALVMNNPSVKPLVEP